MHRFYCLYKSICADKIMIADKGRVHKLRRVLRLQPKDEIVVFDGKGNEYLCRIERIFKKEVLLHIKSRRNYTAIGIRLSLACAIPKKAKMDDIIDKLTQIGVDRIIPLETERTIVKWQDRQKDSHLRRWQEIAVAASEQSGRSYLPAVEQIKDINTFLSDASGLANYDLKIIPTLSGRRQNLKEVLKADFKSALVLIGPEGDFSPSEVILAKRLGFVPVSLGNLVLRVDTAAIVVSSFIKLIGIANGYQRLQKSNY
jgi:16S rRNA (uracil1498-N3)-methyltransferase